MALLLRGLNKEWTEEKVRSPVKKGCLQQELSQAQWFQHCRALGSLTWNLTVWFSSSCLVGTLNSALWCQSALFSSFERRNVSCMKCLSLVIIFEWCFPAKKTSNCLHIPSPALHMLLLVQSLTQAQNKRGNKRVCYLFLQMYRFQKLHVAERSKSTSLGLGLIFHYPLCTPLLPGADWGKLCPTQFKFRKNQKNSTFPCSFCCIFQCNYDLYHILENRRTKLRKLSFNFLSGLAALCCEAHGK